MKCFECQELITAANLVDYKQYTGEANVFIGVMGRPADKVEVPLCDDCYKSFQQKMRMAKARAARKPKKGE